MTNRKVTLWWLNPNGKDGVRLIWSDDIEAWVQRHPTAVDIKTRPNHLAAWKTVK